MSLETVKNAVHQEFNSRKTKERGLKLTRVYEEVAIRAGFKDWRVYCAILKKIDLIETDETPQNAEIASIER